MKKRNWIACAAAMCMMLVCGGCGDKTGGTNMSVIEGDDVREYSSGSAVTTAEDSSSISAESDDSVGGIARTLNIPDRADIDIPVDNCGTIESACIKAGSIIVPNDDRMYVKKFTKGTIGAAEREAILKSIFDESDGIYEYPYDTKETVSQQELDALFENAGASVDYSKDSFIGKIDGVQYELYFFDRSWSTDEGFELSPAMDTPIPEDMQKLGASFVTRMPCDTGEYDDVNTKSDLGIAISEDNRCGLSRDEAMMKAMDYMDKWGFKDVVSISENELIREYDSEMDEFGAVGYEKNGYTITFDAAVSGQAIYQPEAFGVDTISHQSQGDDSFDPDNYYYMERSEYSITLDSDGLVTFTCTWPMKSDENVEDAGQLISWDDAVSSLRTCMPEHFEDYTGYNSVEFNDVRLTYFLVKTSDGGYEAVPVYVFAQVDRDIHDESYPTQLVMIDARDGIEVSIVQDESRFGKD